MHHRTAHKIEHPILWIEFGSENANELGRVRITQDKRWLVLKENLIVTL